MKFIEERIAELEQKIKQQQQEIAALEKQVHAIELLMKKFTFMVTRLENFIKRNVATNKLKEQ